MDYEKAKRIADLTIAALSPHCDRIEIAGSIRRKKSEVKDIEIVAIPKPYEIGLFENGIASIVNKWPKIKGELPCKYTQRRLPQEITLDLFFATINNWGWIYAIRTGSANYSHKILANKWVQCGYKGIDGNLTYNGNLVKVPEEEDLFKLIRLPFVKPENRW